MATKSVSPIHQPRLHEMVADHILKEHVLALTTGERLPTEMEFAAMYQVSVPTVREALRSLVQSGYLHRRQGSGTYRAEEVSAQKTQSTTPVVAVICPLDLADGSLSCHFVQIALHTSKCLKKKGINSQVYYGETAPSAPRHFDETILCQDIKEGRISVALVMADSNESKTGYGELLQKKGIPIVFADLGVSSSGKSRMHDFLDKSVSVLMSHNRRKIACIGFGSNTNGYPDVDFRKIVSSKGGITDESWMIGDLHPNEQGSGYSLMREIWTTGKVKPDGLVLCDDVFFQDTALAIRELGIKVPDQLLIVCSKNKGVRLVASFPTIEIQFDSYDMAAQIANNVIAVLKGAKAKEVVIDSVLFDPIAEAAKEDNEGKAPASAGRIALNS